MDIVELETVTAPLESQQRSIHKVAGALFAFLFAVYAATIGSSPSLDAESAHFGAWNLVDSGTPWIEGSNYLEGHPIRDVWVTQNGEHEVISRAPGVIALSLPSYLISQVDTFSNVPGGVTAAFVSALGMVLLFLALATRVTQRVALIGTLITALGTPVWAVAADAVWPHTLTVFAIGGMAWSAATGRWWLVGIFGGVGLWGRSHFAIIVAIMGLGLALIRRKPSIAFMVGVPSLALLGLMVLWTRWFYGAWRLTGSYQFGSVAELADRYPNLVTNELGLFFSLERGIVIWTPLLLLLLPALIRGWKNIEDWAKFLAIGGLAYTLLQGYAQVFHGGDSYWSFRLGIEFVTCASSAYIMASRNMGRIALGLFPVVAAWQFATMSLGAITGAGGASSDDAWSRNSIFSAIIELPALGAILIAMTILLANAGKRFQQADTTGPSEPKPHESPIWGQERGNSG